MSLDRNEPEVAAGKLHENREERNGSSGAMGSEFELRLLRQLWGLYSQFKEGRDTAKVPRVALRSAIDLLAATEGCVALLSPEGERVDVIRAGIWSHPCQLRLSDTTFRDGGAWSRQVRECQPGEKGFPAIEVASVIRQAGRPRISLLKMDIEGRGGGRFRPRLCLARLC